MRSPLAVSDDRGLYRRIRRYRPFSSRLTMRYRGVLHYLKERWGTGLTSAPDSAILELMSYPGGKNGAGIYQKIINLMPPHDVYIEPFLGGGAVMRLKRPADLNIGLDLSAAAIASFGDFAGGIVGPDGTRASLELAIGDGVSKIERIGDGRLPFEGRVLIYCDPPYLMSTRSGKRLYDNEMPDREHRRLLRAVLKAEKVASIIVSGYASSLYTRALRGWNSIQFESMTRGGYTKTEHLWFNFEPPVALHDYRYLGRDFRERERIKRMKQRWTARLDRMPVLQRQALLSAIADRHF